MYRDALGISLYEYEVSSENVRKHGWIFFDKVLLMCYIITTVRLK